MNIPISRTVMLTFKHQRRREPIAEGFVILSVPRRMLQTVHQTPEGFTATEQAQARHLEQELSGLIEGLVEAQGLFRSFLETKLTKDGPISRACASNTFVTAASDVLRQAMFELSLLAGDQIAALKVVIELNCCHLLEFYACKAALKPCAMCGGCH